MEKNQSKIDIPLKYGWFGVYPYFRRQSDFAGDGSKIQKKASVPPKVVARAPKVLKIDIDFFNERQLTDHLRGFP